MNSKNDILLEQFYDIIYSESEHRIEDAFSFAEKHPNIKNVSEGIKRLSSKIDKPIERLMLSEVQVSGLELDELPIEISLLQRVKKLNLSSGRFKELPSVFFLLQSLTELNLEWCDGGLGVYLVDEYFYGYRFC